MQKVNSKTIHPSFWKLLSFATSDNNIDQEYEKYLNLLNQILYSIEFEGEIVGCIGIVFISLNECEIKHIAVSPVERGKGIGSKMIKNVSGEYPFRTAETDRDAVDFYRNYGFKITSLGEKYPGVERFFVSIKNNNLLELTAV